MARSSTSARRRAETPMAFVRAIVLAYQKYGASPDHALTLARIGKAELRRPDGAIDSGQMEIISATAMRELDDEALGWFSRRLPWGTYGMLCRASLGAPTLKVALKRWCRHHALLTDDVRLSLEIDHGKARLWIEERADLGALREFCLLTCLRYVHGYACWLVDSQLPLIEAAFPIERPHHARVYPLIFPGRVEFGAAHASMTFEPGYLDLPPVRDEPSLQRMLQHALPLTVRPYRRDRLFVERVRTVLGDPKYRASTASALASALHVSVRSLHRHLADESSSLQSLKDEARRERALDLLRRSDASLKELVRKVGFQNEKSFARAFKSWTGMTPSEYRASLDEPAERAWAERI